MIMEYKLSMFDLVCHTRELTKKLLVTNTNVSVDGVLKTLGKILTLEMVRTKNISAGKRRVSTLYINRPQLVKLATVGNMGNCLNEKIYTRQKHLKLAVYFTDVVVSAMGAAMTGANVRVTLPMVSNGTGLVDWVKTEGRGVSQTSTTSSICTGWTLLPKLSQAQPAVEA